MPDMKNLRSVVIALGSVTAFLSLTVFPYSERAKVPGLSWTHNVHVLILPTLLRAAAIVVATFVVTLFIPRKG